MASNRKVTTQWEDMKNKYTECICYSKERGFYTMRIPEGDNCDELLYRPHGYKGFASDTIKIPEDSMTITIESNFGYGSMAYLRAVIEKENRRLLDFDMSKVLILNNCSVKSFDVPVYDWDALFHKIITAYKESFSDKYITSYIEYIEKLSEMLDKKELFIKGTFDQEKTSCWKGEFLVNLFVGKKLCDLLEGLEKGRLSDSVLTKHVLNLCRKYITKVKKQTMDYEDPRTSQQSEYLLSVHKFMCANEGGIEYLRMILDKEV